MSGFYVGFVLGASVSPLCLLAYAALLVRRDEKRTLTITIQPPDPRREGVRSDDQ